MSGLEVLRGFSYALEPIRTRRAWELEAALVRQAGIQNELTIVDGKLKDLDQECEVQARTMSGVWSEQGDADRYMRQLQYLSGLQAIHLTLTELKSDIGKRLAASKRASAQAHGIL